MRAHRACRELVATVLLLATLHLEGLTVAALFTILFIEFLLSFCCSCQAHKLSYVIYRSHTLKPINLTISPNRYLNKLQFRKYRWDILLD